MCCSKQIYYTYCDHWHRSLAACSFQKRHEQCSMIILPDVEYDELCPDCSAQGVDIAHLQTELIDLCLTDRFRQFNSHVDMYPVFNAVNYRSNSCYESESPMLQEARKRNVPKTLHDFDRHRPIEHHRNVSPPQSPFGTRRQSWSNSGSSTTLLKDQTDNLDDKNHLTVPTVPTG